MPTEKGRKRILVRETNWLGDVIMSLPFLDALRRKEEDAKITVLARPSIAAILQHHPAVDKIILCDDQGAYRGFSGLCNMAGHLQDEGFDEAYILPNSFGSALMMWLARVPRRIGFRTDGRSLLLTQGIMKTQEVRSMHETSAYLKLLDIDESPPRSPCPTAGD